MTLRNLNYNFHCHYGNRVHSTCPPAPRPLRPGADRDRRPRSLMLARSRRFARKFFNLNMLWAGKRGRQRGGNQQENWEGGWLLQTNPLPPEDEDDEDIEDEFNIDDLLNGEYLLV